MRGKLKSCSAQATMRLQLRVLNLEREQTSDGQPNILPEAELALPWLSLVGQLLLHALQLHEPSPVKTVQSN